MKVLVIDDSAVVRGLVCAWLEAAGIEICGQAGDGDEALDMILALKPDAICLDLLMPRMDGLSLLRRIQSARPTPAVVYSSFGAPEAEVALESFALGVIDVVPKGAGPQAQEVARKRVIESLRLAAQVDREKLGRIYREARQVATTGRKSIYPSHWAVAIGASAGGIPALLELLSSLPPDLAAGIIVAQHMPESFISAFTAHLAAKIPFEVRTARDGDFVSYGRVLVSPATETLTVLKLKTGGVAKMAALPGAARPVIDAVFESVAHAFGRNAIGVVLSGMGCDGVKGLAAIQAAGGHTLAQDESSSLIWGMPRAAMETKAAAAALSPRALAAEITRIVSRKSR